MKFIITGHNKYGTGVKSSLDLILGNNEIIACDFDCELDEFKTKANKLINDEPVIVVCDLLGGTPFNTFAYISATHINCKVLTHISILALIECYTTYRESNDVDTAVDLLLKVSKESIAKYQCQEINQKQHDVGI